MWKRNYNDVLLFSGDVVADTTKFSLEADAS